MITDAERREMEAADKTAEIIAEPKHTGNKHGQRISPVYSMMEHKEKPKAPNQYKTPEYCRKCIYRHPLYTTGAEKAGKASRVCCFSADNPAGELRGCPAGEGCTRRVIKSERRTA